MNENKRRLLPEREVAKRYSVAVRTLSRWDIVPQLDFPPPVLIRGRRYRDESQLDAFDAAAAAKAVAKRAAAITAVEAKTVEAKATSGESTGALAAFAQAAAR